MRFSVLRITYINIDFSIISAQSVDRPFFINILLTYTFSSLILAHHGTSITRLSLHRKLSSNPTKCNKVLSTILCN